MSLILIISTLLLLVSFIMVHKFDKKISLIKWIVISIGILICYNTFITWLMNLLFIPITIYTLSLLNLLIAFLIYYFGIKKYGLQNFYVDKWEVIISLVISMVCIVIGIMNFSTGLSVAFETTDPTLHYYTMKLFANNDVLLSKLTEAVPYYNEFKANLTIFYVNSGLVIKSFSSFIGEDAYPMFYIISEMFMFWFSGIVFTLSLKQYSKKAILNFLALALGVVYVSAYPLNNMLFGFSYLSLTVIVINLLLLVMPYFENYYFESLRNKILIGSMLFLIMFSIFFGYYLYITYVYTATFIYISYLFYKKKLFFKKDYLLLMGIIYVIPCVAGIIYFVIPIITSHNMSISFVASEGFTYRNLYANILLFIPFVIYYIISTKKTDFTNILIMSVLLFTVIFFFAGVFNIMSSYYFYKNYNILWLICVYTTFIAICKMEQDRNATFAFICVSIYLLGGILSYFNLDVKLNKRNTLMNPSPILNTLYDMHSYNKHTMFNHALQISKQKRDVIFGIQEQLKTEEIDEILVNGSTLERLWFLSFTDIKTNLNTKELGSFYEDAASLEQFMSSDYKYYYDFESLTKNQVNIDQNVYEIEDYGANGYLVVRK